MWGSARRSGAFLPSRRAFTRNMADHRVAERRGLALVAPRDTVTGVVEARPQGAWTLCPIRYPSPVGRLCAKRSKPPVFPFLSKSWLLRRGSAHGMAQRGSGFDAGRALTHSRGWFATAQWRGQNTCTDCFYGVPRLSGWPGLRPAVKVCLNRRFWAPVPAPVRRPFSMAALPLARLSARPATWPIARPIPAAAAEFARAVTARDDTTMTTGAPCAGGLFIAGVSSPETGGRDEICSRRS